jgi:hypothetical protein
MKIPDKLANVFEYICVEWGVIAFYVCITCLIYWFFEFLYCLTVMSFEEGGMAALTMSAIDALVVSMVLGGLIGATTRWRG